jgi:hypothetical protein
MGVNTSQDDTATRGGQNWLLVEHPEAGKPAWTGYIRAPETSGDDWKFELVRQVELKDIYDGSPMDNGYLAIGLLDFQKPCTLIQPIVLRTDPGSMGVGVPAARTIVSGRVQSLLTGLEVHDSKHPMFKSANFSSESLSAWYSETTFEVLTDWDMRQTQIATSPASEQVMHVAGIGELTFTTGTVVHKSGYSGTLKSNTNLHLEFQEPISIEDVQHLCHGVFMLFRFLAGVLERPPGFNLLSTETYEINEKSYSKEGKLELGGLQWAKTTMPHRPRMLHVNGGGGAEAEIILDNFFAARSDILNRVSAIEDCRFSSRNIVEKFKLIVPVLEEYLKRRYSQPEEKNCIASEKAFFDHVNSSDDDVVKQFSKKHVSVKDSKTSSLKTLLERAIQHVNSKGFNIGKPIAYRAAKRRNRLFHSAVDVAVDDVQYLWVEMQVATGLLLLHTLEDLGIDVTYLAHDPMPILDLVPFLKHKSRTKEGLDLPT